jgi:hypothetical protein
MRLVRITLMVLAIGIGEPHGPGLAAKSASQSSATKL